MSNATAADVSAAPSSSITATSAPTIKSTIISSSSKTTHHQTIKPPDEKQVAKGAAFIEAPKREPLLQTIQLVLGSIPEDNATEFRMSLTHAQEITLRSSMLVKTSSGDDEGSDNNKNHYRKLLQSLALLLNSTEITSKDDLLVIERAMQTAIEKATAAKSTTRLVFLALSKGLRRLPAAKNFHVGHATRDIQAVAKSPEQLTLFKEFVEEISWMVCD